MKDFSVEIKGENGLKRDIATGAIISTDHNAYESFMRMHNVKMRDIEQMKSLSEKYDDLENKVNRILKLLEERL